MLKFEKLGEVADIPYDMGLLDGLSDPVIVVNEKYNIVHHNRAYKRIIEADPLSNATAALTKTSQSRQQSRNVLTVFPGNPMRFSCQIRLDCIFQ